jgi:hypothetical protein
MSRRILLLLLLLFLTACARPQRTIVITVGGAGFSQMHDLRKTLERECPDAKIVSAGAWDAYKTDLPKIATQKPREHIILIGHSFGCSAISHAADQLSHVDLAIFIDPAWNDFPLSAHISQYLWFTRSGFDLERRAKIIGASNPIEIQGSHNEIPHSADLIAQIVAQVQRISREPDSPDRNSYANANNRSQR